MDHAMPLVDGNCCWIDSSSSGSGGPPNGNDWMTLAIISILTLGGIGYLSALLATL